MSGVRYRIYPTLLHSFLQYEQQTTLASGEVMVTFEGLLDRINRVRQPTTVPQQRGIDFETALVSGEGEEAFAPNILAQMRRHLPRRFRTQVFVRTTVRKDIELYGVVDVLGGNRAIDIKTTAHYTAPKFSFNPQNLYLLGLHAWGVEQLDYLITDFKEVYLETYHYDAYDFEPLLMGLTRFADFLETNRPLITDPKVFREAPAKPQKPRKTPPDGLQTSLF